MLTAADQLQQIHSTIVIDGGDMSDEWVEQLMAVRYVHPDATVLEIGGNIGRNSLVLSSLLNDDTRLVVLESSTDYLPTLLANRDRNNRNFHVVGAAMSERPLVQKGWDTKPADGTAEEGWHPVDTVTYNGLTERFGLTFDTLVMDCEGAAYYILQDFPHLLDTVHTVLMEADFYDETHKTAVDQQLKEHGFTKVHSQPLVGFEWVPFPQACRDSFYEVWQNLSVATATV